MTEKQYNRIVADRRDKEDFVVEDDDGGYLDDGEEHYFEQGSDDERATGAVEAASGDTMGGASKKRGRSQNEEAARGSKKVSQMFWEMRSSSANTSGSTIGPRSGLAGKKRKQPAKHRHAVAVEGSSTNV